MNDLTLVWILGEIQGSQIYKDWGFSSFKDWYREEGTGTPSLSHAYALARIGRVFLNQREEIERLVQGGRMTIRTLMDLVTEYERGEPLETVIDKATKGEAPEAETPVFRNDPERPREFRLHAPQGDIDKMLAGLIFYCIYNSCGTLSNAFQMLSLGESINLENAIQAGFFDSHLKGFIPYLPIIQAGKFFCAACNNIPLQPTLHHVLPVSIGQGYGPQALLCWAPCHEEVVQKHHRQWANRWGKVYGFTHASLKAEAATHIAAGTLDPTPTVIITGNPKNISK